MFFFLWRAAILSYHWHRIDRVARVKPANLLLDIKSHQSGASSNNDDTASVKSKCYSLVLTSIVPYNSSKPKTRSERDAYYKAGKQYKVLFHVKKINLIIFILKTTRS